MSFWVNMIKLFSVPLLVNISELDFINFKLFLKKNHKNIFDVYFTWPIPPFSEDAYGGITQSKSSKGPSTDIDKIMEISEECNVRVSATFNNIYMKPDINNLKLFLENFRPLYERGIRSITLPFSSWVYSGEIQKNYPELFIKNTVMWKVHSAREFWNLAETGFDYVNLDRTLLRNQKDLWEIHEARQIFEKKTGKKVILSILANEFPCSGFCPFREEHSSLAQGKNPGVYLFSTIFNICLYSHMKENNNQGIKMNFLKMAFVPPFEDDFNELSEAVDVFKMFGRLDKSYFNKSMEAIEDYANGEGFLVKINKALTSDKIDQDLLTKWRTDIKNCNFNCWKCNTCDQLYSKLSDKNQKKLVEYKVY